MTRSYEMLLLVRIALRFDLDVLPQTDRRRVVYDSRCRSIGSAAADRPATCPEGLPGRHARWRAAGSAPGLAAVVDPLEHGRAFGKL